MNHATTAYSLEREGKVVIMLEIKLKTGNCHAFPYAYLTEITFNPSEGITLEFAHKRIEIKGWQLEPIYEGLKQQRVNLLHEQNPQYDPEAEQKSFISGIRMGDAIR